MHPLFSRFPFADDARRFAAVFGVAGVIAALGIVLGIRALPIPPRPVSVLPENALVALRLPAGPTLETAAAIVREPLPVESAALEGFAKNHVALAAALTASNNATITLFPSSANDIAQFLVDIPGLKRPELLAALAETYPSSRTLHLPDGTRAEELIADPAATEARLSEIPGTSWRQIPGTDDPIAIQTTDQGSLITNLPVAALSFTLPASRSFCLSGAAGVFPGSVPSRWQIIPLHVPLYRIPLILPLMKAQIHFKGKTAEMANFCRK